MDDVNLVGRYGENSVDLEGSAEALRILSRAMQNVIRRETFSLEIPATPPLPYSAYCKSLVLEQIEGPVGVSCDAVQIVIAGSSEFLKILAGNIDFLADQQNPMGSIPAHLHVEYYEGHPYLDTTRLNVHNWTITIGLLYVMAVVIGVIFLGLSLRHQQ